MKTWGECVVSVFWFSRYSDLAGTPVETNGSRDQWLAALAGNYELLPRERGMAGLIGGRAKERQRERRVKRRREESGRICERSLVTQLNLRSSRTRSDVIVAEVAPRPDINCRPCSVRLPSIADRRLNSMTWLLGGSLAVSYYLREYYFQFIRSVESVDTIRCTFSTLSRRVSINFGPLTGPLELSFLFFFSLSFLDIIKTNIKLY